MVRRERSACMIILMIKKAIKKTRIKEKKKEKCGTLDDDEKAHLRKY